MKVKEYILTKDKSKFYDPSTWTYGSEYELADFDKRLKIPESVTWDYKDVTVMNSNGVATDPRKDKTRIVQYGGELNTIPCKNIDDLVDIFAELKNNYHFTVNNSCNLHNHIFVPDLDLNGLKSIVAYYEVYRNELIEYTDYIPEPDFDINLSNSESKLINARYVHHTKANHGSRHGTLPPRCLEYKLTAENIQEFHKGSIYGIDKSRLMNWSNANRAGINTLQTRRSESIVHQDIPYDERPFAESGTIEFRMHSMPSEIDQYKSTLILDYELMNAMLNTGESVKSIVERLSKDENFKLPEYIPVEISKYLIYIETKFKTKTDEELIKYLTDNGLKYE